MVRFPSVKLRHILIRFQITFIFLSIDLVKQVLIKFCVCLQLFVRLSLYGLLKVIKAALFNNGPQLCSLAQILVNQLIVRPYGIEELVIVRAAWRWEYSCEV